MQLDYRADRSQVGWGEEFAVCLGLPRLPQRSGGTSAEFVLALDTSPSMENEVLGTGVTRWQLARRSLLRLVEGLDPKVGLTLLTFSEQAEAVLTCAAEDARAAGASPATARLRTSALTDDELDRMRRHTPAQGPLRIARGTNFEVTLRHAFALLQASRATSRRLVVITDGDPTAGERDPDALATIVKHAQDEDVYTDVIGIGDEVRFDFLEKLAGGGIAAHVTGANDADRLLSEVLAGLAEQGQRAVASGATLRLRVNPAFELLGVYELYPNRLRLDDAVTGPGEVRVQMGAIAGGDERPVFGLRLRAPSGREGRPELLQAQAELRWGGRRDAVTLPRFRVEVRRTSDAAFDGDLLAQMRSAELERRVADLLAAIPGKERQLRVSGTPADLAKEEAGRLYRETYREAVSRAEADGLFELADQYREALAGLDGEQAAQDVVNRQRSMSRRSATTPRELLFKVEELDPRAFGVAPAAGVPRQGGADGPGGAPGRDTADDPTRADDRDTTGDRGSAGDRGPAGPRPRIGESPRGPSATRPAGGAPTDRFGLLDLDVTEHFRREGDA